MPKVIALSDEDRKEHLQRFWSEVWNEKHISASRKYLSDDVELHASGATLRGRLLSIPPCQASGSIRSRTCV